MDHKIKYYIYWTACGLRVTLTTTSTARLSLLFPPFTVDSLIKAYNANKQKKKILFYPFYVVVSEANKSLTVSGYNDNKDSYESEE